MKPIFIILDNHNYIDYPIGGPLTFSRNLMMALGNRIALVGNTDNLSDPVGKWFDKEIDGITYKFFASRFAQNRTEKPIIPDKIKDFIALRRNMKAIRSLGVRRLFIQTPDAMMAVTPYKWESVCFRFTGVFNPVAFSKYVWGRPLGNLYERLLFRVVHKADCILATADERAIDELVIRSHGALKKEHLHKFPTRVHLGLFNGKRKEVSRRILGLHLGTPIFLFCARISWTKGWDLVIESFLHVINKHPDAILLFVGDGEDVPALKHKIQNLGLEKQVRLFGRRSREDVADFYIAADVYCVGSHIEGWSNSMLEALAAGCALVSTNISGAYDLIAEGENGFICTGRESNQFGEFLNLALDLKQAAMVSRKKAHKYDAKNIHHDLFSTWKIDLEKQ